MSVIYHNNFLLGPNRKVSSNRDGKKRGLGWKSSVRTCLTLLRGVSPIHLVLDPPTHIPQHTPAIRPRWIRKTTLVLTVYFTPLRCLSSGVLVLPSSAIRSGRAISYASPAITLRVFRPPQALLTYVTIHLPYTATQQSFRPVGLVSLSLAAAL